MSEYSARARNALAAATAKGLTVMKVTRDRMTRLASSNSHTENDKQAIRALERRVKGPAPKANRGNRAKTPVPNRAKTPVPNRGGNNRAKTPVPNRGGARLQDLPAHLFRNKIAPRLAARNLAALQLVSKNNKARVGNALEDVRFASQKSGQAPLVRRLREAFASGMGRDLKKVPTRKAFLELQKRGWQVSDLKVGPAPRFPGGIGSRSGADAAWRNWYARVVIRTADGTAITVSVNYRSINVRAWNKGTEMGDTAVNVDAYGQWTLWSRNSRLPLGGMIEKAFKSAARREGVAGLMRAD